MTTIPKHQEEILQLIKVKPTCRIRNQYLNNISQVSIDTVKKILDQTFMNSVDMEAILCLFSTFLQSSKNNKSNEQPYILDSKSTNWLSNMEIVSVTSVFGTAYKSTIINQNSDISVILKVAKQKRVSSLKQKEYELDLYREYIIGVGALNKLRYYVPTLSYVLGIFKCFKPTIRGGNIAGTLCKMTRRGDKTPYVIYERASGPSISTIIRDLPVTDDNRINEQSFKKILEIFIQILITLEIAQQECSFTHFDLHTSNVMSKYQPLEYSVSVDNNTYKIKTDTVPIIIDYGASSVKINNKVYGVQGRESIGIMKHMIPGFDMYRFLTNALAYLQAGRELNGTQLLDMVEGLFKFYEKNDVYNVAQQGAHAAVMEYAKNVSTSFLATYTPKMFLDWIITNYEPFLTDIVEVDVRNVYMPIHPSILTNEYNKIFSNLALGKTEAVNIINNCSNLSPSYIMNKYTIYVLTKYNRESDLKDPKIDQKIKFIEDVIEDNMRKGEMINVDVNFLRTYINVRAPTEQELRNTPLPMNKRNTASIVAFNRKVRELVEFKEKMKPYLQYFYTLREIGYDNETPYREWIRDFSDGNSYKTYSENITKIERLIRWNEVFHESK